MHSCSAISDHCTGSATPTGFSSWSWRSMRFLTFRPSGKGSPRMTEKPPVKILRVMDRLNVGGPAIHAILLTRHFNPNGHESNWRTVLVYGQEGPTEGNMLD